MWVKINTHKELSFSHVSADRRRFCLFFCHPPLHILAVERRHSGTLAQGDTAVLTWAAEGGAGFQPAAGVWTFHTLISSRTWS
jgi:hypothetical protein